DTSVGIQAFGNITVNANSFFAGADGAFVVSQQGDMTVNSFVSLVGGSVQFVADGGTLALNGAAAGGSPLFLSAKDMTIAADIGSGTAPSSVWFNRGEVHYGTHAIKAGQIHVGD